MWSYLHTAFEWLSIAFMIAGSPLGWAVIEILDYIHRKRNPEEYQRQQDKLDWRYGK